MRKLLGKVGVDSGQLMVCDPCYIDSQWQKEGFEDIRIYKDPEREERFQYGKDFSNFETMLPYYHKTVNQLIEEGILVKVKNTHKVKNNFSYNACCKATLSKKHGGQLKHVFGHPGVGVAFRSGLGDGTYEVWANIEEVKFTDEKGKERSFGECITKVEIILI